MKRLRWITYKGIEICVDTHQDGAPLCYFTLDNGAEYGELTLSEAMKIIDLDECSEPEEPKT
jgi:hypothetical protein